MEDIVNNDYPDLSVPLGPGKGFPGLGGAKMTLVVRREPSGICRYTSPMGWLSAQRV